MSAGDDGRVAGSQWRGIETQLLADGAHSRQKGCTVHPLPRPSVRLRCRARSAISPQFLVSRHQHRSEHSIIECFIPSQLHIILQETPIQRPRYALNYDHSTGIGWKQSFTVSPLNTSVTSCQKQACLFRRCAFPAQSQACLVLQCRRPYCILPNMSRDRSCHRP